MFDYSPEITTYYHPFLPDKDNDDTSNASDETNISTGTCGIHFCPHHDPNKGTYTAHTHSISLLDEMEYYPVPQLCRVYQENVRKMDLKELETERRDTIAWYMTENKIEHHQYASRQQLLEILRFKKEQEKRAKIWAMKGGGGNAKHVEKRAVGVETMRHEMRKGEDIHDDKDDDRAKKGIVEVVILARKGDNWRNEYKTC